MKKLIRILSVFLALRIGEFIFGAVILGVFTYFGDTELAHDWRYLPRPLASMLMGAGGVFAYYLFTGYLFTSLATPLFLAVRPNPHVAELSGINAGAFFVSAWLPLPIIAMFFTSRNFSELLLWLAVLIFDALLPLWFRPHVKNLAFTAARGNT